MKRILSFLFLILIFPKTYCQNDTISDAIATMFKQGKYWGVVNIEGEELVKPKYLIGNPFKSGFAKVGNFKFINKKGELLDVQKKLKGVLAVGQFSDELLTVKIDGKWGYMDKDGKLVIPTKYSRVTEFNDGNAIVKNKLGHFIIDKKGNEIKVVTEKRITEMRKFSDGLAAVMLGNKTHNRLGYINGQGKLMIKAIYVACGDFKEGVAWVIIDGDKAGFIDKEGEWVIEPKFFRARDMDPISGMARIRDKDGWGYTNLNGEVMHLESSKDLRDYSDSLCMVRINKKWGYMNVKGEVVISPEFDAKAYLKINKLKVNPLDLFIPQYNFFSKSGKANRKILAAQNDGVTPFVDGYATVRVNGRWGVIDKKGQWVLPPIYNELFPFAQID
jgi:WG repeat protein